jgi:hypothetical protein
MKKLIAFVIILWTAGLVSASVKAQEPIMKPAGPSMTRQTPAASKIRQPAIDPGPKSKKAKRSVIRKRKRSASKVRSRRVIR